VKDYLEIDSEVSTGELMTTEDIVEIVTVNTGSSCQDILDSNEIEPPPISTVDALNAITTLINYFHSHNLNDKPLVNIRREI
jgi:hypothetical protein